jgi:hypothetical protein
MPLLQVEKQALQVDADHTRQTSHQKKTAPEEKVRHYSNKKLNICNKIIVEYD